VVRYIGLAVLFIAATVLQSTIFDFLKIAGVKPDLVLLLVIYFAFTNGPLKGAFFGLLLGLLIDLQLGYNIGMYALALLFAGFVAGWFETRMYKENLFIALVVVFLATLLSQLMILFSGIVAGRNWEFFQCFNLILFMAVYNVCLVPFTYPWFHGAITTGVLRYRPKHEN